MFIIIISMFISNIEARVICGDPNATSIVYTGFSCPLQCTNVIAVVEQLKILDYHKLLEEEYIASNESFQDDSLRITKLNTSSNKMKRNTTNIRRFHEYSKILTNKASRRYLQKEINLFRLLKKYNAQFCSQKHTNSINNSDYQQCIRRSNYEYDIVRRLTKYLNKYANSQYQFTKEMVVLLLRKVLGSNVDLRQGDLIMPKILNFLRHSMEQSLLDPDDVVYLTPRHCLSIFVPGCYCKTGFLEQFGRCITLEGCLKNGARDLSSYIDRIKIY